MVQNPWLLTEQTTAFHKQPGNSHTAQMVYSSLFRPCPEAATVRCSAMHCLIAAFHSSSGFSTVLEAIISSHSGALVYAEGYIVISLELGFNQ